MLLQLGVRACADLVSRRKKESRNDENALIAESLRSSSLWLHLNCEDNRCRLTRSVPTLVSVAATHPQPQVPHSLPMLRRATTLAARNRGATVMCLPCSMQFCGKAGVTLAADQ